MNVRTASHSLQQSRLGAFKCLVVFTLLAVVTIFSGRSSNFNRRIFLINSDDAGMCSSVNNGTIAALKAGLLRSTSIMVCCPGFQEFAEFARLNPQYDYGVHLTLTCDLRSAAWGPVLPEADVPSLVDKSGFFHASTDEVMLFAKVEHVKAELQAQIRKALDAGIRITHLDHHMFAMDCRNDLRSLYVQLGIEFGLPIRFARRVSTQFASNYNAAALSENAKLIAELERAGLPILDKIESANYSVAPSKKRNYFLDYFRSSSNGVTEIVIHCAAPSAAGIEPPDAAARIADAECFSSLEFMDELSKLRIDLLDWEQFRARRK